MRTDAARRTQEICKLKNGKSKQATRNAQGKTRS